MNKRKRSVQFSKYIAGGITCSLVTTRPHVKYSKYLKYRIENRNELRMR